MPDVNLRLDGATTADFASAFADVDITRYLSGFDVRVSRQMREWKKDEQPFLEKLVGHDDVWAICLRRPKPGWRLIGRFLAKDVFVGLGMYPKRELMGGRYAVRADEAIVLWNERFPGREPIRSDALNDYIGYQWTDIDDEDF
jgi:hypothetical protein